MKQKDVFLQSEGNAYFERNTKALLSREFPGKDNILKEFIPLASCLPHNARVLEVGCGNGGRLAWIKQEYDYDCHGLDPSSAALEDAKKSGIKVHQGTADFLPFDDNYFDVLVYGFCLYLCDREDLFKIAAEADRVLKNPGWLIVCDFFSPTPVNNTYHHCDGIFSFKMDYRRLFDWHPGYECFSHNVYDYRHQGYSDNEPDWIATSLLRKNVSSL